MFNGSYKSHCAHAHVYYALRDHYNEASEQNILVVQFIFALFGILFGSSIWVRD